MPENLAEAERRIEEARRLQRESLDLSDLALSELPASLGNLPNLKALDLGKEKIDPDEELNWDRDLKAPAFVALSPLAGLQGLQILDLDFCAGVTDLFPLAKLQELQTLDLSFCTGVTDLGPLDGLQALQTLNLISCTGVIDLLPLARLQALQSLNLLFCTGVTDLKPLVGLQALQKLYLSSCPGLTDLKPLARLQALQTLDLSRCVGVTKLLPLAELQTLKTLNLAQSVGVSDLSPLAELRALQKLDLSSCPGVTDLKPLAGLRALQKLYLSSCPGVTDLKPLARLRALQKLDLSSCPGVTDLKPLRGLQGLQTLKLSHCIGITDLSPLTEIQGLQSLNLFGSRSSSPAIILRDFIIHSGLNHLIFDEAIGLPREVLSYYYEDNCLNRLRTYFSELNFGAEAENEVKVILLGNGRVGKTQLCRRFRGEPFDESIQSTHGVQIWREELLLQTEGQEKTFQVNWWDFGGQDIYHGTHALFLRSRAVFLILWTPELENRDEYSENGVTLRNQPLAYWLDYVRSLAGEGSPVIVVQSQCDRFADRRPAPPRPDGLEFFESCSYSAKSDLGREALEAQLRDALRYLLERNGALEIGRGRAEVRRRLYDWRGEDQKRKPEEREHRTLTLDEFRALCDEAQGIVNWEHALDYFHQTGVVFYKPDLFADRIVLDQDWALDAVYTVFHRGRAAPWLRDSGRFTREDLAQMVWHEHSPEEQKLFLGLMQSCGVCFPCGKTDQGETRYVAPDLLPKFEAVAKRLHAWNEAPGTPTLRLEYPFFHPAVIRGLMGKVGERAGDLAEYWKYGLWLKDGRRDTQLLVQFQDTSTDEAPGAGALEIKAQGKDPLGLLREIRKAVLRRRIGEEPEELLTLDGTTVARSALATVIEGRVLDQQKKPVPAAAFAAFFEDREHSLDEARKETPKLDINPKRLTESEKPREVFISYAWGDETPEGKVRAEAVDGLTSALAEDGFLPVRDRDHMRLGDQISAFIRSLTRADLVVAVISDKYLRSPYCMYEIYKLWQRFQGDANEMFQHLVPIVLPEVKVKNIRERLPYLEFWADQAESLEALIRNPKLRPSRESWEEVRQVREFAHHVDGILVFLQDVLMPRKLEAHLDDGFQAVREALQRRIPSRSVL